MKVQNLTDEELALADIAYWENWEKEREAKEKEKEQKAEAKRLEKERRHLAAVERKKVWAKAWAAKKRERAKAEDVDLSKVSNALRAANNRATRLEIIPKDLICPFCNRKFERSKQWFVDVTKKRAMCRSCYALGRRYEIEVPNNGDAGPAIDFGAGI